MAEATSHDPYAPWRESNFSRYLIGKTIAMVGQSMVVTAIGWELYERTGNALALGWVGLVLFVPVVLLGLPAGQWVDRGDRRLLLCGALALFALCSVGLAGVTWLKGPLWVYYALLFAAGVAQALYSPASSALLPGLVSAENLTGAISWSTGASQLAYLLGPAAAGWLIAATHSATTVFLADAAATSVYLAALLTMRYTPSPRDEAPVSMDEFLAGLRFVWNTELILAGITLDMVAVLLGGAVALLPIFAKDLLHVGPTGLGYLTTAPSVGAFLMGLVVAHVPPFRRNGPVLLAMVAGFGAATIGFGLAPNIWVAWAMLFLTGAFDMVSMVIRSNLVQHLTPDAMRGRVGAVHSIFIGTSNELGGFESGLTASWWGPVRSVVFGGIGTLAVVAFATARWPGLRSLGVIESPAVPEETAKAGT